MELELIRIQLAVAKATLDASANVLEMAVTGMLTINRTFGTFVAATADGVVNQDMIHDARRVIAAIETSVLPFMEVAKNLRGTVNDE